MPFTKHVPHSGPTFCNSPEHNPPGHQVLPPGSHTWQCPKCKQEITFVVPEEPRMDSKSWTQLKYEAAMKESIKAFAEPASLMDYQSAPITYLSPPSKPFRYG